MTLGSSVSVEDLAGDPHPVLAQLRAAEPVAWIPALGGWLITSYDVAFDVLRDARTFTVDDPRFTTAQVVGPSMLSLDGPEHTRHRDAFARAFRPAATRSRFTSIVSSTSLALVEGLASDGAAEIRGDVAGPLAISVLASALGIRSDDAETVRSWYDAFVSAVSDLSAGREPGPAAAVAVDQLREYVAEALAVGDSGSLLVGARADLELEQIVSNAAVMMFGGIDTVEGMIANAAYFLLGDPALVSDSLADSAFLDAVIEESVRMEPAAAVLDRYATADASIGGASVRQGDLVMISVAGVNRDPAVFSAPDEFDPRRTNLAAHLGFARGPHFCFGAHLARLETQTVLRDLLRLWPSPRLGEGAAPPVGLVFRKPLAVPVSWTA